jgi:hypothetical protein
MWGIIETKHTMEIQLENKRLILSYISDLQDFIALLIANRDESLETLFTTWPSEISEDRHKMLKNMIVLSAQDLQVAQKDLSIRQNELMDVEERIRELQ